MEVNLVASANKVTLVLLTALLPWLAHAQQSPNAFPPDYTAADFAIATITPTVIATPTTIVTFTGVNLKIEDLPRTKALPRAIPRTPSPTTAMALEPSLPTALPMPPMVPTPTTLQQLNAYGAAVDNLPTTLWSTTSATTVQAALTALTSRPKLAHPTIDALTTLLTAAAPPPIADASTTTPWLVSRAQALTQLGQSEGAWLLWQGVPPSLRTAHPSLTQGWLAAALLAGRVTEACTLARQQAIQQTTEVFFKQATLICPLVERGTAQGQGGLEPQNLELAQSLAAEALPTLPPLLRAAVQAVLSDKPMPPSTALPAKIDTLTAALLVAYPALLTDNVVARLPAVALRRLVSSATLPLRLRTLAAEYLAAHSGQAPDAQTLATLYRRFAIPATWLIDPIATARADTDAVRARALLWQATLPRPTTDEAKAPPTSLRATAWQSWSSRVQAMGAARLATLLLPSDAQLPPDSTLAWLAPSVARSAVLAGQPGVAWAWSAIISPSTLAGAAIGLTTRAGESDWQAWQSQLTSSSIPAAARWLAIASAGGITVPPSAWQAVATSSQPPIPAPNPAFTATVQGALSSGQLGLAVLTALMPQQAEDPAAPGWLELRVKALSAAGLQGAASSLTQHALLPASGYMALPPAPPVMQTGQAPAVNKGKQLGTPKATNQPATNPNPQATDGPILPPPRVTPTKAPTKPKV